MHTYMNAQMVLFWIETELIVKTVKMWFLSWMSQTKWKSGTFLEIPPLTKLAAHYNMEFYELKVLVARNFIKSLQTKQEKTFTIERVHRLLDKEAFSRLKTLFQVALTIPVTSCSCEWSFSHFGRMKTWLGTRMMQERLDDLAVLAIERGTYTTCTDEWRQAGDCLQLYEEKKNISVMYVSGP